MDVIIMPSTSSLLHKLATDFPDITFIAATTFSWSPEAQTVSYNLAEPQAPVLLLHELSHGILGHHDYRRDIELLAMETAAWEKAKTLAHTYGIVLHDTVAEDNLDTYRDWMRARSACPECAATGFQSGTNTYECVACAHTWRVNEARLCSLRRYSLNKK